MVEQKHYNVVLGALKLACEEIKRSNIEITKENMEMLQYKMHGSLVGYYLMKSQDSILKTEDCL